MSRLITKGQLINERYEIVKSIGEGGMANVYLAKDIILDRKVAIKVLRGDLANDEKFIRRFQREALSASSLSHPNIVEMYDVGEDSGNYYIVMEYVEGRTLKQLLKKRGNLTVSEAVDIMIQLTDGIAHAHDSYIIHRDLKPQNIMIEEDGRIKITDFGIAMALNSTQLTQTNSVMGSVHYLPPEQANGKGSTIKCDIYSMGILFYELLTGILPFKGDNAVEIALKHMKDPLPSVRKQNPSVPQSVENIILKATAKNPKNRYNDVKEMYNDLKKCLNEEELNQDRYVYPFPEHEIDDTKTIPTIKREQKTKKQEDLENTEDIVKEIPKQKNNKMKWLIIILSSICGLLLLGLIIFLFVLPSSEKTDTVQVPDVSGMKVADAEQVLIDAGFEVNEKTEQIPSNEYEKGLIVKTDPAAGRNIKKGKEITLYESTGSETYKIENYVGKNYIEVQTLLENMYKLKVKIEKKETTITEDMNEQQVIAQDPAAGTEVKEGDSITLYIPEVVEQYPNFKDEEYTLDEVKAFADKYKLKLTIAYEETDKYKEGTIIKQSRTGRVVIGATLKVTVAKKIPEVEVKTPKETTPKTDSTDSGDKKDSSTGTDSKKEDESKTQ